MTTLSKSRFVSGSQCEKKLYFDVHRNLKPPITVQQQALFDAGHALGILAQKVFPNGRDATSGINKNWSVAIELTKALIANGKETIYEAAFSISQGFAALDILHHTNGERWAIEVKSSTSVKDYHLTDAAFQYYVMQQAGYTPDKFFIMHVTSAYRRKGIIDPVGLFHLENITSQVIEQQPFIAQKHRELVKSLEDPNEPSSSIGPHCDRPFDCEYKAHCWAHIPEPSVFNLYNARGKQWELYNQGIIRLEEIPSEFPLNHWQQLQVNNSLHVDRDKLLGFIGLMEGPLYFFDFETINPAIPLLEGCGPFQQIPFQYSLHVTDILGNPLSHSDFLSYCKDYKNPIVLDPRRLLIDQLKKDIGPTGSIVAFNAGFEVRILNELAEAFPEEKEYLYSLTMRFVDLLIPFRAGWYYHPNMIHGASIKSVLPAIAPSYSYKDLKVNNGSDASLSFLSMLGNHFQGDENEIRKDLIEYCNRDTFGMVVIYQYLRKLLKI